jgi:hypothetical protein
MIPMTIHYPQISRDTSVGSSDVFSPLSNDDDGLWEVGTEWCRYPYTETWPTTTTTLTFLGTQFTTTTTLVWKEVTRYELPNSDDNCNRFYNKIGSYPNWDKTFNWGDEWAWERDFKDVTLGGTDNFWVDAVDIVLFNGHGGPNTIHFSTTEDRTYFSADDARWGDGDLEWIALDACKCLTWTDGVNDVFDRWGQALQGVHMILGFSTNSDNVKTQGANWAYWMVEWTITTYSTFIGYYEYTIGGLTVMKAWFKASELAEDSDHWSAALYATEAVDPWNPPLDDPSNDHLWGAGYVCSDPISPRWWVWISDQC